jgi:glycosyltransferase involved in cell wall biosynthesis
VKRIPIYLYETLEHYRIDRENIISVIIPVKNREQLIGESLESLTTQGNVNLEVIVVDDNSSDNTVKVSREIINTSHLNGKVIPLHQNRGLPFARNIGLVESKGIAIKFLDSDDVLAPKTMEMQWKFLSRNSRCIPYCKTINLKDTILYSSGYPVISGDIVFQIITGGFFACHAPLTPWKLFTEIGGFDESLLSMEDDDFWLRAALAGWEFRYIDDGSAIYRRHAGQMIHDLFTGSKASIQHLSKLLNLKLQQHESKALRIRLDEEFARVAQFKKKV